MSGTIGRAPSTPTRRRMSFGTFGPPVTRVLLAIVFLFPILLMFMSSLKPTEQLLSDTRSWRAFLPVGHLSFENYRGVFRRAPAGRFLFNSFLVSVLTVLLGLLVNSLAGFSLARLRWRGQKFVLTLVIATLIVPFEVIAIPLLFVVNKLPWLHFSGGFGVEQGWINSYRVQIIPFVANAFSIFLFTQHFKSLPVELDEAALVDGASWWHIYSRLIVPLSGPVFATVSILTFLPAWNQYLWPKMVTQSESIRPVMIGLQYFFQLNIQWGEIMAYLSLITVPVLILFVLLQRAFVESIASTGVKG